MKRIFFTIFVVLILLNINIYAQRHELGVFLGTSYYIGDLNESGHFGMPSPAFGLAYRYAINPRFALKINGYYGKIRADDAITGTKERNLSFESPLIDIGAQVELNFFEYSAGSQTHRFSPYITAGVSLFHFNPKAEFEGELYELQPLGTEGQNTTQYPDKPYKLTSLAIPFGIGCKWSISPGVTLSFSWGLRKTFTDYLDDVSTDYASPSVLSAENGPYSMVLGNRMYEITPLYDNGWGEPYDDPNAVDPESFPLYPDYAADLMKDRARGNSKNNDWYSFAGVTVTFKIVGPKANSCPAYQRHFQYREYYIF